MKRQHYALACAVAILAAPAGGVPGQPQVVPVAAADASAPEDEVPLDRNPAIDCSNRGPFIVFFDFGEAELAPEALTFLDRARHAIERCPLSEVVLSGHTDRSGSQQTNMALSQARAEAARDWLIARGLSTESFNVEAFGESRPRVPTADGVREFQNRRVELSIGPANRVGALRMPDPSDNWIIPRDALGASVATLGKVNERLRNGMRRKRYREPVYLAVADGFVMVAPIERREPDADPWPVTAERWELGPAPPLPRTASNFERLRAAFFGGESHAGLYRMYVFVVTTAPVRGNLPAPTQAQAEAWLARGDYGFPDGIRNSPFTPRHDVHVLVYDYHRDSVNGPMIPYPSSPHDSETHLRRSQIFPF